MFPGEIATPRLRLRALSRAVVDPLDAYDHFAASRSSTIEEGTKLITWDPHETPKEALEFLERAKEGHEPTENAVYIVFPHDGEDGADELVDTAGSNPEWDKRRAVFGTRLRKEFWGRGYSGEQATAFFAAVFDVLGLDMALAYAMSRNGVSYRAIEKYTDRFGGGENGLFPNGTVGADGTPRDVRGWSVTREQWETATDGNYDAEFRRNLDPDDVH